MKFAKKDFLVGAMFALGCKRTKYSLEHKLWPYIIPLLKEAGFTVETGKDILNKTKKSDKNYFRRKQNVNAIYAVRGEEPNILLNAHLDQVDRGPGGFIAPTNKPNTHRTVYSEKYNTLKCIKYDKKTYDELTSYHNKRIRRIKKLQEIGIDQEVVRDNDTIYAIGGNIGGDDKCGVAIILGIALNSKIPLKIYFTSGEECSKGAVIGEKDFYKGVDFSFTIDRRGSEDIVEAIGGTHLQSREFRDIIIGVGRKFKETIKIVDGGWCDAGSIINFVPECLNVSCGYYNPHQINEFVSINDMYSTYQWMHELTIKVHDEKIKPFRDIQPQVNNKHRMVSENCIRGQYYPNSYNYGVQKYSPRTEKFKLYNVVYITETFICKNKNIVRSPTSLKPLIGVVKSLKKKNNLILEVISEQGRGERIVVPTVFATYLADAVAKKGERKKLDGSEVSIHPKAKNYFCTNSFANRLAKKEGTHGKIVNVLKYGKDELFIIKTMDNRCYESFICVSKDDITFKKTDTFLLQNNFMDKEIYIIKESAIILNEISEKDLYISDFSKEKLFTNLKQYKRYTSLFDNGIRTKYKLDKDVLLLNEKDKKEIQSLLEFGDAAKRVNSFLVKSFPEDKKEGRQKFWKQIIKKRNRHLYLDSLKEPSPSNKKEMNKISEAMKMLNMIVIYGEKNV